MTKVKLSISDTPYTIGTYQTFTLEGAVESILDGLDKTYDELDWTYDMDKYIADLATSFEELMRENLLDDVIKNVTLDGKPYSPKFYNFSTDNCGLVFDIDPEKLQAYISYNKDDYEKNKKHDVDGFWWFGNEIETMLDYYLEAVSLKKYDYEAYYYDQMDRVDPHEYVTYEEAQQD